MVLANAGGILWEKGLAFLAGEEAAGVETGVFSADTGVVYLRRDIHFEPIIQEEDQEEIVEKARDLWSSNRPAIISTHRFNYVTLDREQSRRGLLQLDILLGALRQAEPEVAFLTDWEVGQLYLQGYSLRSFGDRIVARNFTDGDKEAPLEEGCRSGGRSTVTLPANRTTMIHCDNDRPAEEGMSTNNGRPGV
jgi:hypothetical protein